MVVLLGPFVWVPNRWAKEFTCPFLSKDHKNDDTNLVAN
jgi:hypothetical protein